jgi:lipopolysaccharide transport system permease protein
VKPQEAGDQTRRQRRGSDRASAWIENRPTRGRRSLQARELWSYRELVVFLARRDIKVRYKQAVFGGAWAVINPLASAALFTVVFGRLAKVPSDGIPFLLFAYAGSSLWSYFSSSVSSARSSLVSNADLITKVYFPRLVAPLASVVPGLVDLAVASVILAGLVVWRGAAPGVAVVAAPLFVAAAVLVAFGVGTLVAAASVQYRDIQQVFTLAIQLWLFATPVAYPSSLIKGGWRWVYHLNPMAGVIEGWRWSVVGGPAPGREAWLSAAVAVAVLVIGVDLFQRSERRFADVI